MLQACNFIEKETLAKVFSCEFWEISKNTFFLQNTSGVLPLNMEIKNFERFDSYRGWSNEVNSGRLLLYNKEVWK